MTPEENEGIRKVPHFSQKIIDDNVMKSDVLQNLFDKSKKLIDSARSNMGQMTNAITVLTSFFLGKYIIEQEQQGSERAKYGAKVLDSLSSYLTEEYGRGFSRSNVAGMR